jgi:glutamine amidotransferase
MVLVVDYRMGNIGSILNMFKRLNVKAIVSSDAREIERAEKIVLPGVGSFDVGMRNLRSMGLIDPLRARVVEQRIPLLGICLGMQLLANSSEEGNEPGLGWVDAKVVKFEAGLAANMKIPHMGWNSIQLSRECPLFRGMYENPRFYFVHSYYVVCRQEADVLTRTLHGVEFVSAFQKDNIIGVQFHPEKSHKFGMKLLENFAAL